MQSKGVLLVKITKRFVLEHEAQLAKGVEAASIADAPKAETAATAASAAPKEPEAKADADKEKKKEDAEKKAKAAAVPEAAA